MSQLSGYGIKKHSNVDSVPVLSGAAPSRLDTLPASRPILFKRTGTRSGGVKPSPIGTVLRIGKDAVCMQYKTVSSSSVALPLFSRSIFFCGSST